MKTVRGSFVLLLASALLSACISAAPTPSATATLIAASPTSTPSPTLAQTATWTPLAVTATPPATLTPAQAEATLRTLLREPVDCAAPCFWGIMPGQTSLVEAQEILSHWGLPLRRTNTRDGKEYYALIYDFDSGLRASSVLAVQDGFVIGLTVDIRPETQKPGLPREWLAFSPETLVDRYGSPSRVDFYVGRSAPAFSYAMAMYFDAADLIIQYAGYNVTSEETSVRVCPLTDQYDGLRIWSGAHPERPPREGVPLERATSLTMEEFAQLMTGSPDKACFTLSGDAFP